MSLALLALCLMAAEGDGFDARVQQGLEAYRGGRYDEAAAEFLGAFELRPEPELVFNAARSYEKGLASEKAIEQYERFLGLQGTTAALRTRALDALRELRAELRAIDQNSAQAAAPPPAASAAPAPAPAVALTPAPRPSFNRVPEAVLLSAGGASLVVGTVFGLLALESRNDFDDADPTDPARVILRSDAEDQALLADVFLAAGGVSVATGLILLFVRRPKPDVRAQLPNIGFNGRMLSLSGRF